LGEGIKDANQTKSKWTWSGGGGFLGGVESEGDDGNLVEKSALGIKGYVQPELSRSEDEEEEGGGFSYIRVKERGRTHRHP